MLIVKHAVYRWLSYTVCSYFLLLFQLSVAGRIAIAGVVPFLPPLLLGCLLTFEQGPAAAVYALLLGSWCDTYAHSVLLYTLLYPAAALLVMRAAGVFAKPSILTALMLAAGVAVAGQLLYSCFFLLLPARAGWAALWPAIPAELLYTLCLLPFVYVLFWRINRR